MKRLATWFRRYGARLLAAIAVLVLYELAQLPALDPADATAIGGRFRFTAEELPTVPGPPQQYLRPTNPALGNIASWISAVGAAAAVSDLDGTGLPDDVCYVDTRTGQVIVAPVPGTGARYKPFVLDPAPLPYDAVTMAPMGCLPGHMTEGPRPDILVYYWGRTPVAFLRRLGVPLGPDAFQRQEIVPASGRWYTNAATFADLTGSGHADLVIGNYFPDGARILDAQAHDVEHMQHSMSLAFNGGEKHLLLWSGATRGAQPSVRFVDLSAALPPTARVGWTLAIGAAPLTRDQLPELYIANDFGPDRLLYNISTPGKPAFTLLHGVRRFTTPKSKVLGQDSFKGMGVDFADVLGNGQLDMCVSNITEPYALEESNFLWVNTGNDAREMKEGIAPFIDRSETLGVARGGWAWDCKLADFDNSGEVQMIQATGFVEGRVNRWPELQELAMGNDELLEYPALWPRFKPGDALSDHDHTPFFVRDRRGVFFDIARQIDFEPADRGYVSRGIAIADVFGNGKLDFVLANQWADSIFYRNDSPSQFPFLSLHIAFPVEPGGRTKVFAGHPNVAPPNRPAIGATAMLTMPDGSKRVAIVDGGNGHSGKRSPDIHFGLGAVPHDIAVSVEIRWRDGGAAVRHKRLELKPGWYTVILGPEDRLGESKQ
jgi:enediyne biosynthesis protein E4